VSDEELRGLLAGYKQARFSQLEQSMLKARAEAVGSGEQYNGGQN
jgi:hypothetical protein